MDQSFNEHDKEVMTRLAASRQELKKNPYRPLYHFAAAEGAMNDPNGLCFWKGKWHLFFQGGSPEATQPSWGHAVSTDLIHWQDLPYAIEPGPELASYSGATWVEEDRVIAMYHGVNLGNMIAVSGETDLIHWEKLTNNAVIAQPCPFFTTTNGTETICGQKAPAGAINMVYDPCIWKKDDCYYSLSGGAMKDGSATTRVRTAFLYRSKDLIHWEYLHSFIEGDIYGRPGDDCGCPYFVPIGDQYMLLHFSHRGTSHYLIGDYDKKRDKFIVRTGGDFGFGPTFPGGLLAPSAFPDGNGGVMAIFNVASGLYTPENAAQQIMSLPRRITLEDGELKMEVTEAVKTLRGNHKGFQSLPLPANEMIVLDGYEGNTIEMEMEINAGNSQLLELEVLRSPDCREVTRICFYRERGYRDLDREAEGHCTESILTIETSRSSIVPEIQPRMPENAPVHLEKQENLKLHIFIDKSLLEVFVNDRQCAVVRVYPGLAESRGIAIGAGSGDAEVIRFDMWEMGSIYA